MAKTRAISLKWIQMFDSKTLYSPDSFPPSICSVTLRHWYTKNQYNNLFSHNIVGLTFQLLLFDTKLLLNARCNTFDAVVPQSPVGLRFITTLLNCSSITEQQKVTGQARCQYVVITMMFLAVAVDALLVAPDKSSCTAGWVETTTKIFAIAPPTPIELLLFISLHSTPSYEFLVSAC